MNPRFALVVALASVAASATLGCGPSEEPYKAKPAVSGKKAAMPAVPTLPQKQKKGPDGAFTVWGVTHDLRSRVHAEEVIGKQLSITGYIVKTNYEEVPKCAVHKTGKGDPPDCKAPIPTFWIADEKGETKDMIPVMGWASNFAHIFTLIEDIDRKPKGKESEAKLADAVWGVDLPNPIPNVGAKVKVTGNYAITFTKASSGTAADPKFGIMTVEKVEYLEPPPEKAYLPGMKKKP